VSARSLLSTVLFFGLTWAVPVQSDLGQGSQAIVNGEASDSADDVALYVLTRVPGGGVSCTGTLIAPNLVATALHCLTGVEVGQFSCNPDGTVIAGSPGDGHVGALVDPSKVEVYFGAQPTTEPAAVGRRLLGTGSSQICRNDLAFVVLDRDLPGPIAAVRLSDPVRIGETVRVIGYGQTETSGSRGRFRRFARRIVDVGPDSESEPVRTAAPRTFVISEGPCHGDSGGPALSEETGALLGVYSLAAGPSCTGVAVRNVYTRFSSFESLTMAAFAEAGAEPVLENQPSVDSSDSESSGCAVMEGASLGRERSPTTVAVVAALAFGLARARRRGAPSRCGDGRGWGLW
jgi:hypothetical protein